MPLQATTLQQWSAPAFLLAELVTALLLLTFWLLYLWGSVRRRPPALNAVCFHSACLLLALAVLGPLDELAQVQASAHMLQHMLFMVVVTPLWVLSAPQAQFAAVFRRRAQRYSQLLLNMTRYPLRLAYMHALVVWFWHIPRFYILALEQPWWHLIEQLCFVISATLLWWALLQCTERSRPSALLALLFTLMNTGFLGAILTFADSLLYSPTHQLADQQLAGLLMWVPGGMPYLAAAAWLGYCWLTGIKTNDELS